MGYLGYPFSVIMIAMDEEDWSAIVDALMGHSPGQPDVAPACIFCQSRPAEGIPYLCERCRSYPPRTVSDCGCSGSDIVYGPKCATCSRGVRVWMSAREDSKSSTGQWTCLSCGQTGTGVYSALYVGWCRVCRSFVERRSAEELRRWWKFIKLTNPEVSEHNAS